MQKRSSNDVNQIAAAALAQVTQAALRQALTNATTTTGPAQDEITMPKRSSTAASVLAEVTRAAEDAPAKNPAAVALGRKGGLKGGKARAESLSAAERARIARKAAKARWKRR